MNGVVARFLGVGAFLAVLILAGAGQAVAASGASLPRLSADGTTVVFRDDESLVKADDDANIDVYSSTLGGEAELISRGPEGNNAATDVSSFVISADASVVDFLTDEQLVAADNDSEDDLYQRSGGTTTLLSTGGNGAFPVGGMDINTTGTRSFFTTSESLDPLDTDTAPDAYLNEAGVVSVLSTDGVIGNSNTGGIALRGASDDGSAAFFYTNESLVPADMDLGSDAYRRTVGGSIALLSKGTGTGNAGTFSGIADFASDGSVAAVETFEQLSPTDTDTARDIYLADGGNAVLASSGGGANTDVSISVFSVSDDGATVVFFTSESLLPADGDAAQDIYASINGTLTLISDRVQAGADSADLAAYEGMTPDGGSIFFRTLEQITAADTDSSDDLYRWSPGPVVLRISSAGNGAFGVGSGTAFSDDGSEVLFSTAEPLDILDTDAVSDVYQRSTAGTTLISGGVFAGNGPFDAFAFKSEISGDGVHRVFTTSEPMLPVDVNGLDDIYEYSGAGDPQILSLEHVPPVTTLTKTPEKKKKQSKEKKNEKFKFESDEAGSTFECQKDEGKQFKPCTSPYKKKYSAGKNDYKEHTFSVQATDVPGNAETSPASYTFKRKLK